MRFLSHICVSTMRSIFRDHPCQNYINENISDVLTISAGGTDAVRTWTSAHWSIFRLRYGLWLLEMNRKNSKYTESYLRDVSFSFLFFLILLISFSDFTKKLFIISKRIRKKLQTTICLLRLLRLLRRLLSILWWMCYRKGLKD